MRISDWSSGVCSSDLGAHPLQQRHGLLAGQCTLRAAAVKAADVGRRVDRAARLAGDAQARHGLALLVTAQLEMRDRRQQGPGIGMLRVAEDRKSGVSGKSVSVRVDSGGPRVNK